MVPFAPARSHSGAVGGAVHFRRSHQQMSTTYSSRKYRLKVNSYDRTSSWLVALLVISAVAVAGLLIVYFARRLISKEVAIPVTPVEAASRPGDAAMGLKRDPEPPGIEEVPELIEPQLADTLTALTSAVATKTALLADEDIDGNADFGHGRGLGDSRRAGTGSGGGGPTEPQCEIRFQPDNLQQYATWLDYFKIELGVLGRDNEIYYAYNLSHNVPDVRVGEPVEEQRLYMNSALGQFAPLDRQLAQKAGIADRGRIILQFFPPETQAILLQLEQQYAKGRPREQIRLTVFRVTPKGEGFEFSVINQTYR
jgi:hypothetical protein